MAEKIDSFKDIASLAKDRDVLVLQLAESRREAGDLRTQSHDRIQEVIQDEDYYCGCSRMWKNHCS